MKIARSLERHLEKLFEGPARRVFSGQIHPTELAEGIAREADLARYEHITGPATANSYALTLNPKDLEGDAKGLSVQLELLFTEFAADHGLRLEGPAKVRLQTDPKVPAGQFRCSHRVEPGYQDPWARLAGSVSYDIGPNRAMIGRGEDCDVTIMDGEVSRRHAVIYRQHGETFIVDLASANGTIADAHRVGSDPMRLVPGAVLTLAAASFRFLEV